MTAETPRRVKIVCSHCGSDQVVRDAWAIWNTENQHWELHSMYDHTQCDICGKEDAVKQVEIP